MRLMRVDVRDMKKWVEKGGIRREVTRYKYMGLTGTVGEGLRIGGQAMLNCTSISSSSSGKHDCMVEDLLEDCGNRRPNNAKQYKHLLW